MTLIRDAWRELWMRNRGGGLLTLAFWYTLILSLYQYLVVSRLGPSLPQSLRNLVSHPGTVVTIPHLSGGLWVKLILVYLTFLLIVLPYAFGGLYGGIAAAIKENPQAVGFLAFFRYGYENFWRALGQIVLAILYALAVTVVFVGLFVLASQVGGAVASILGVVLMILLVLALLWMAGTLLFWVGYTFFTDSSPTKGLGLALRWGLSHLGRLYKRIILLIGLLLATMLVVTLISRTIPFLGPIIMVLVLGMVIPAFVATYALLFYGEARV